MSRTSIEMAREAAGDDWALFREFMPEIHRLAELVRAEERARMADQPAPVHDLRWLELLRKNKTATDEVIGAFLRGHAEYLTGEAFVLAAPQPAQQEPVATLWQHGETGRTRITMPDDIADCDARWFKAADLYTSPPAQRKPTDEMVVAAARVLSDRQAAACNVDCGDMWKLHGNDFIDDARAALEAAHGIGEKK